MMPSSSQESVTIVPTRKQNIKYRRPISKRPTTLRAFTFVKNWQSPVKLKPNSNVNSEDADVDTNDNTHSDDPMPNTESSQRMETTSSVRTTEENEDREVDRDDDVRTRKRNEAASAKDGPVVQNNTRTKERTESPLAVNRTLGNQSYRRASVKQVSSKGHSESNETQEKTSSEIEVDRQEQKSSMRIPPAVQRGGSTEYTEVIPQSPMAEISSTANRDALPFMNETLGMDGSHHEQENLQPLTTPLQNKNSAKLPFTTSTPLVIARDNLPADEPNQKDQFQQNHSIISSISGRQRNNTIVSTPLVKSKDAHLQKDNLLTERNSKQPKKSKNMPMLASTPIVQSKDRISNDEASVDFERFSQVPSEEIQNITVIQPVVGYSPTRTRMTDKPSITRKDLSIPSPIAEDERPQPERSDRHLTPQPGRNLTQSKIMNYSKRKLQMKTPANITSNRSRRSENRSLERKTMTQTPVSGPVKIQRKRPTKKKSGLVAPSSPQKIHSVRIWQVEGQQKRKAQDALDLDVILNIVEETAFEYREDIQVPSVRKAINGFASRVQRDLRETIEQTQKLKRLKTDIRRVTSTIRSQRRELLLTKKENTELMQEMTKLEKSAQEKEKKSSKEEIQRFLLNLRKLQQDFTSTQPTAEQFQNLKDVSSSS